MGGTVLALLLALAALLAAAPRVGAETPGTVSEGVYQWNDFCSTIGVTLNGLTSKATLEDRVALRLVPSAQSVTGSAFRTLPLRGVVNMQTQFTFRLSEMEDGGGDGFAFVMQRESPYVVGADSSGLGYAGITNGIAVEFDLYANKDYGEKSPHIAVHMAAGPSAVLRASEHSARVQDGLREYLALPTADVTRTVLLSYSLQPDGHARLSIEVDSTAINTVALPAHDVAKLGWQDANDLYVGFTASTGGGAFMNVDILDWSLTWQSTMAQPDCESGYIKNVAAVACVPNDQLNSRGCKAMTDCVTCSSSALCCGWSVSSNKCNAHDGVVAKQSDAVLPGQCPWNSSLSPYCAAEGLGITIGVLVLALGMTCAFWSRKYRMLQARQAAPTGHVDYHERRDLLADDL
eukprot:PLAT4254.1.p1 GENE.PLAT4254.1~~PLAT4254.1.p1  ORF type:complete len:405 (+),score=169.26 PLAT4254.1:360-1574(+)